MRLFLALAATWLFVFAAYKSSLKCGYVEEIKYATYQYNFAGQDMVGIKIWRKIRVAQ